MHDMAELYDSTLGQVAAKQSIASLYQQLDGRAQVSRQLLSHDVSQPSKERAEKCLAKLDDEAAASVKAGSTQLQIQRQAELGEPIRNAHGDVKCLSQEGDKLLMQACSPKDDKQKFVYNTVAGGTLTSKDGSLCLQRDVTTVKMHSCTGLANQIWSQQCGAWVNGRDADARVLERLSNDQVTASRWEAKPGQLWEYNEVVRHTECSNKRFKVMQLDGTTATSVHVRNFVGMPNSAVTISMWMKGTKGTPFSYATKDKARSIVLTNIESLDVYIQDFKLSTGLDLSTGEWLHVAVTWSSETGAVSVIKNGQLAFTGNAVQGDHITAGGCVVVGQLQTGQCGSFDQFKAFQGEISDVQVFSEAMGAEQIRPLMYLPVDAEVIAKAQSLVGPEAPSELRLALLSRQFGSQELHKPVPNVCDLDKYRVKSLHGPTGMMEFSASGDVHFQNFANCVYSAQSLGEWTAVKVDKTHWEAAPLMIQFRTSPFKTAKGTVSMIDGCAVRYFDDQASAGFGGFNTDNYPAFAAINGKQTSSYSWHVLENMKVRAHGDRFEAVLNDGTHVKCQSQSMYVSLPRKYTGKISGLAGKGHDEKSNWECGPNSDACLECTPGEQLEPMLKQCPTEVQNPTEDDPFNGFKPSSPLVKWFKSWQVDGKHIPSVFSYSGDHGVGSFNRSPDTVIKAPEVIPNSKQQEAFTACKEFQSNSRALEKCIFDFMVMGKAAVKHTKRDQMAKREAAIRSADEKSVRDMSKYHNEAKWSGNPSWGCVSGLLKVQEKVQQNMGLLPDKAAMSEMMYQEKHKKCEAKVAAKLQALRTRNAGQPIMTKDKKSCIFVQTPASADGKLTAQLGVRACSGQDDEKLVYNRLAGGSLHTKDGKLCLTREPKTEKKVKVYMSECAGAPEQQWQRLCGAWANGNKKNGRVLELDGDKVIANQWIGDKSQLWHYEEVVKHNKCSHKRFKTLQFDGTTGSAVMMRNFIGMPSYKLTVAAWIKGTQGTVFSYASKYKLNSFTIRNPDNVEIWIRDTKVVTGVSVSSLDKWVHIAATWESKRGKIALYKDGVRVFKKEGFAKGARITAGGCLMVGQSQESFCRRMLSGQSWRGDITDLQMWSEDLRASDLRKLKKFAVPPEVVEKAGHLQAPDAPSKLRLAFLTRQYASQELNEPNPPVCDLDQFKVKRPITGPTGTMHWSGSGDVHYRNFAGCCYDDQSVGEWVAVKVHEKYYESAPLMIQFRTSPRKTRCPWCQNGAVSFIDGCAVKFHEDQASAGFGGYSERYRPYAAANGQQMTSWHKWKSLKNMKVRADGHRFEAVLNDGTTLKCNRGGSIYVSLPKKYTGKIGGIAGTGEGINQDFKNGPNAAACPECQYGHLLNGMKNQCPHHYVYRYRDHPLNGNRADKPLVKFFKSWQVDGDNIPSVFYYLPEHGPGSFNRINGQKIKPPKGTQQGPSGKAKKAHDACKDFRESPKAREKCIFDFMVLGKVTLKATKKDRMTQRQMNGKKPTDRSVRDLSRYKNDGVWTGHRNWGCIGDFLEMQAELSTAKPKKPVSNLKWIVKKGKGWNPQGAKPLFGSMPDDTQSRYQASLKDCQKRCIEAEDCLGITRFLNNGQGGNCWGWNKGTATVNTGHMISYVLDRTGNLTKALEKQQNEEAFNMHAVNASVVRIQLPGKQSLNLAEVAVFDVTGEELQVADVALSTTADELSSGENCIDGNIDTFCATKAGGSSSWLEIRLGGFFEISKVSLLNRKGCCQDRIKGAVVTVMAGQSTEWESTPLKGQLSSYDLFTTPALVPGSFVALKGGEGSMWCKDHGQKVTCNTRRISDWQKFLVVDMGNGKVGFKGGKQHHKFFCGPNARGMISCDHDNPVSFRPFKLEDGVAFRTESHKYCKDSPTGIVCSSPLIDADATFSVQCLENCGPTVDVEEEIKLPLQDFYLKSSTHNRCVHGKGGDYGDDTPMVFHSGCDGKRLLYRLTAGNNGYFLQHSETGKCAQPLGGEAEEDGTAVVIHEGCDFDRYLFEVVPAGGGAWYLRNKESGKCLRPAGGAALRDNTPLVFDQECSGDDFKFLLESIKDEAVQLEPVQLSDSSNWNVMGAAPGMSIDVAAAPEARSIKSRQSHKCIGYKKASKSKAMSIKPVPCKFSDKSTQGFLYDRLGGGLLKSSHAPGSFCLTRNDKKITMMPCTGQRDQIWKRQCGAWANGDGADGRVLTMRQNRITAEQWSGEKNQLWDYEEVVKHNECSNKRFKVMQFDGTSNIGIMRRNFIGMPAKHVTVSAWVKGAAGTLVSYASKHKVKSFVVEIEPFGLVVTVRNVSVKVPIKLSSAEGWQHLAVSWDNRAGDIVVFTNGEKAFEHRGVAAEQTITAGGCLVIGQLQKQMCSGFITGRSLSGQVSDFQVWKGALNPLAVADIMSKPVPEEVIKQAGKVTAPEAHINLRLAYLSRQYASQELSKPGCDLDAYKVKKISGPKGTMRWSGSGDVHYRNFAGCCYDDQSVGEWVAVKVKKESWNAAPLMIQFRTSPRKTRCPWCQNGAVSYIDGCAVKFHEDQASAGFGGYSERYRPYAAVNDRKMNNFHRWVTTKNMKVRADAGRFQAVLTDGTKVRCQRQSIFISMPRKYTGKIEGIAGSGLGGNADWNNGPNKAACPECNPNQALPAMKGQCPRNYVYRQPNHPLNGNRPTKPLVRFFQSWQVDGNHIPSVFYYDGNHGAGSFNRINGEKIKPPASTNKQPRKAFSAAEKACKDFRESPKMRSKCIFDFMIMGEKALKDSKKDRINQRMAKTRKPTARSVRDMSRYKNDGEWLSKVSWSCAGEFLKSQGSSVERFSARRKADTGKEPKANKAQDSSIRVSQGRWMQTEREFELPVDAEADIKAAGSSGSIYFSLFNTGSDMDAGLTLETGATNGTVKIHQKPAVHQAFPMGTNNEWHHVQIKVDSDGDVYYMVNGQTVYKGKTTLVKGKLSLYAGTADMLVKNAKVVTKASSSFASKQQCLATAAQTPQDAGDTAKLPDCPIYTCEPSVCQCKCPGVRCDTFDGVVGRD